MRPGCDSGCDSIGRYLAVFGNIPGIGEQAGNNGKPVIVYGFNANFIHKRGFSVLYGIMFECGYTDS